MPSNENRPIQGEFDITGRESQNRGIGEVYRTGIKDRNRLPAEEFFQPGQLHPVWPEWRWDGEKFRRAQCEAISWTRTPTKLAMKKAAALHMPLLTQLSSSAKFCSRRAISSRVSRSIVSITLMLVSWTEETPLSSPMAR